MTITQKLIILSVAALVMNVPLGYRRAGLPKSAFWMKMLYIHLSIPFIVAIRIMLDLPFRFALISLTFAVAGQIVGSRFRKLRRV